jgi:hypothetical protein
MHRLAFDLAAVAALGAGCATAQQAVPPGERDSIEVVYHPGEMFYSIEDGGAARFRTSEREDRRFTATHEDFVRVRDLLEPLRETGLTSCDPAVTETSGYVAWRHDGVEQRRPAFWTCTIQSQQEARRRTNTAYNAMRDWADARWEAPPGLPSPQTLTLTWQYWGRTTSEWTVPRGGEAHWSNEHGEAKTFPVTEAEFDRLRDIFRPYEGRRFECERVMTDGAYGHLTWSQPDHDDQQLKWDTGCTTGDAADVFARVDQAVDLLKGLRDR